jgi:hypothetical protein
VFRARNELPGKISPEFVPVILRYFF